MTTNSNNPTLTDDDLQELTDRITSEHPERGQLNRARLKSALGKLESGRYCLLRVNQKPRQEVARKQMKNFFRGPFRLGKLFVRPEEEVQSSSFNGLRQYVSVFCFEVP